jgi:hypothetical protein
MMLNSLKMWLENCRSEKKVDIPSTEIPDTGFYIQLLSKDTKQPMSDVLLGSVFNEDGSISPLRIRATTKEMVPDLPLPPFSSTAISALASVNSVWVELPSYETCVRYASAANSSVLEAYQIKVGFSNQDRGRALVSHIVKNLPVLVREHPKGGVFQIFFQSPFCGYMTLAGLADEICTYFSEYTDLSVFRRIAKTSLSSIGMVYEYPVTLPESQSFNSWCLEDENIPLDHPVSSFGDNEDDDELDGYDDGSDY